MFVIRGTTVSAEHVSSQAEPLNLKEFIYELDVPVIVGGCDPPGRAAPDAHRCRGVLVGFGGGSGPHHADRPRRRRTHGQRGRRRRRRASPTTSTSPGAATST